MSSLSRVLTILPELTGLPLFALTGSISSLTRASSLSFSLREMRSKHQSWVHRRTGHRKVQRKLREYSTPFNSTWGIFVFPKDFYELLVSPPYAAPKKARGASVSTRWEHVITVLVFPEGRNFCTIEARAEGIEGKWNLCCADCRVAYQAITYHERVVRVK